MNIILLKMKSERWYRNVFNRENHYNHQTKSKHLLQNTETSINALVSGKHDWIFLFDKNYWLTKPVGSQETPPLCQNGKHFPATMDKKITKLHQYLASHDAKIDRPLLYFQGKILICCFLIEIPLLCTKTPVLTNRRASNNLLQEKWISHAMTGCHGCNSKPNETESNISLKFRDTCCILHHLCVSVCNVCGCVCTWACVGDKYILLNWVIYVAVDYHLI